MQELCSDGARDIIPHVGVGISATARDDGLGWRLTPEASTALSLGLKATRGESTNAQPEHRIGLEMTARW